jgi:prepilin-type N-terminal cleavage/methylation domain-containing protein
MNTRFNRSFRGAFTLVELLVVIIIIVIGATLLIPSAARILESNSYASAVNLVSTTLANARANAIRTGLPTGVVFLFDTETQVCSLQVVELRSKQGGALTQYVSQDPRQTYAQVFRPAIGSAPVELPAGIAVLGLSFSTAPGDDDGSLIDEDTSHWYAGEVYTDSNGNDVIPWIFPRNDPLHFVRNNFSRTQIWERDGIADRDAVGAVRHAATFMIRFSETGAVVTTSVGGGIATPNAYLELPGAPLDRDVDFDPGDPPAPVDALDRFDPETGLGEDIDPNPEVLLRSAHQLSIVELGRMTRDLGIEDPWFLRPERSTGLPMPGPNGPNDDNWYARVNDDDVSRISLWIDFNAEIISFNRYTGEVLRKANP